MVRLFTLLLSLLVSTVAMGQGGPPGSGGTPSDPPATLSLTSITITHSNPTRPTTYTDQNGRVFGIIGNVFEFVDLDSTAMANLKNGPRTIVDAPGAGRYVFPYRLFAMKMGDWAAPTAAPTERIQAFLSLEYTDQVTGFLPVGENLFFYRRDTAGQSARDFLADGNNTLGADLMRRASTGGTFLKGNTPIKIGARINLKPDGISDEDAWTSLWSQMGDGDLIRIYIYYNIVP